MQFKPILRENKILAFSYEEESFHFIFGTRYLSFKILLELYPFLKLHQIKQVHGNDVIRVKESDILDLKNILLNEMKITNKALIKSDAHWTEETHVFLSIQTADCVPILMSDGNRVASVHAGWRGLVKGILPQVIKSVFSKSLKSEIKVALGPHIQDSHFEVRKEVRNKIAFCYKKYFSLARNLKPIFFPHHEKSKCFVSLKNFLLMELIYFGLSFENIFLSFENTCSSSQYFSYRRDGKKKGFQISGVFKKQGKREKRKYFRNKKQDKVEKSG